MHSIWEKSSWLKADIAIIGGGLVGISTAIEILDRHPKTKVVVFERALVPTGASTRNAGFACFGSVSEIASDIDLMGRSAAQDIVRMRIEGLSRLRARCKGADIGYEDEGGHEIFQGEHPALSRIDEVNNCVEDLLGPHTFQERSDLVQTYGLSDSVTHLIRTPFEAIIDSGKLVNTMWHIAQKAGVDIRTGARISSFRDNDNGIELEVVTETSTEHFRVGQVIVATNAWIPDLVHAGDMPEILPGRGQILVTKPLTDLKLLGSFHFDEGFYYFRRLGNRVLLGGGRNLDIEGERTTDHSVTARIQDALETMLRRVILPHHSNVEIEHRWAGTMAFTSNKQPFVGRVKPHTIVAFGCNGMGVALSSGIAELAASLL